MEPSNQADPPSRANCLVPGQSSRFIKTEQARFMDIAYIVFAIHEQDIVKIVSILEVFVVEQRLARSVAIGPEIQDVERLSALIQQIIQGFREGVLCGQPGVLDKRIAKDADVGRRSQIGLSEISMLSKREIVVMEGMGQVSIWVDLLISLVRHAGPDPHYAECKPRFGQVPIFRIEQPQRDFAQGQADQARHEQQAQVGEDISHLIPLSVCGECYVLALSFPIENPNQQSTILRPLRLNTAREQITPQVHLADTGRAILDPGPTRRGPSPSRRTPRPADDILSPTGAGAWPSTSRHPTERNSDQPRPRGPPPYDET